MLRELVPREAEGTYPDLGVEIDAGKGIQIGRAGGFTAERSVGEDDEIWTGSNRRK